MFRNKIVLRADLPTPSPFFLLQLRLPHLDPSSSSGPSPPTSPPPLAGRLEALCWKLSRRWRIACFLYSCHALIVYQRAQGKLADQAVKDLIEAVPNITVGVEEELTSPSLIAKAVEIGLRAVMLDHKWTCIGDYSYVDSMFGCDEEGNSLCSLDVQVQPGTADDFVFIVSPEVLRFSRYKIADLLSSNNMRSFNYGEEVSLDDGILPTACTVIPCLWEGHIDGLSKSIPADENFDSAKELWPYKHGVALQSDYFISVQLAHGGCTKGQWFPSAYVLRGSGFAPAPQSIRCLKALKALESFTEIVGAWDFFGQGMLKVKEVSSLGTRLKVADWEKAANVMNSIPKVNTGDESSFCRSNFIPKDLLSARDFRTPKPAYTTLKDTEIVEKTISSSKPCAEKPAENVYGTDISSTFKFVPNFRKVAPVTTIMQSDVTNKKFADGSTDCISCRTDVSSTTKVVPIVKNVVPFTTNMESGTTVTGKIYADQSTGCSTTKLGTTVKKMATVTTSMQSELGTSNCCPINTKSTSTESSRTQGSKDSRKQEKPEVPLFSNTSARPGNVLQVEAIKKKTVIREKKLHRIEEMPEVSAKTKGKQIADQTEIAMKVMNSHKRGDLQSLTIADLKCFLASKKAKVGGKKGELIQRVTALLA